MDYRKIHDIIIERAKNRVIEGYYEKHHIIPRCLGGTDDSDNIACLLPEEHYLVHQLLVKIHPTNVKLAHAAKMMCVASPDNGYRNNKLYGWLRKRLSDSMKGSTISEEVKTKIGNSRRGKLHTQDAKDKMKNAISERWIGNSEGFADEQRRRASTPKKKKDGYFQPKSEEHARNISLAARQRTRHPCPHCSKLITKANINNHMKVHNNDSI
jgi:hypothetical protein